MSKRKSETLNSSKRIKLNDDEGVSISTIPSTSSTSNTSNTSSISSFQSLLNGKELEMSMKNFCCSMSQIGYNFVNNKQPFYLNINSIGNNKTNCNDNCMSYNVSKLNQVDKKLKFVTCQKFFNDFVSSVMRSSVLVVGSAPHTRIFRLLELEMYCHHPVFPDPYVHCSEDQNHSCQWYFHKANQTYKGGSYKGLDITMGGKCSMSGDSMYGGLLIRTIMDLRSGAVITGPSLCVDEILKTCNSESIVQLVSTWSNFDIFDLGKNLNLVSIKDLADILKKQSQSNSTTVDTVDTKYSEDISGTVIANKQTKLVEKFNGVDISLKLDELCPSKSNNSKNSKNNNFELVNSLRVGIYLNKKLNSQDYCGQLLRFLLNAPLIKKGKTEAILGQLYLGKSHSEIATLVGVKENAVASKEKAWLKGKTKKYSEFLNSKKTKVDEMCEIFGSVHQYMENYQI